jgi:DNA invertase Pin-like site-specific DNA recombinase
MSEYIYPPPPSLPPGSTVIAYLRDSGGPNQEESIGQQERVITEYCQKHGLVLTRIYSETGSGRNTKNRKKFLDMYQDVMISKDDLRPRGLLLWSYSRFSRNVVQFNRYLYALLDIGLIVHSLTEQIPEGLSGQMVLSITAYTHAKFSEDLGKNIKRGIKDMVSAGYSNGGQAPKGYIAVRDHKGIRRNGQERTGVKWELDPELSPLVLQAWQMRAEGKSYGEITKATGGRVYTSKPSWASHFKNKSYLGIGKAGDLEIPDHHDPIITPELWEAVRKVEKEVRKKYHYKRTRHPSLLSGISFCLYCGAAMVLHTEKNYRSYACGKRERQRGGYKDCAEARRVNARKVESLVLETILTRILLAQDFEVLIKEIRSQFVDTSTIDEEIGKANNLLINVERSINRLLNLAERAGDIEELSARLVDLKREKAELETRMKVLKAQRNVQAPEITPEALSYVFAELRAQIQEAVQSGDILTAKRLISRVVNRIEMSNKTCIIHYTLPIGIPAESDDDLSAHKSPASCEAFFFFLLTSYSLPDALSPLL